MAEYPSMEPFGHRNFTSDEINLLVLRYLRDSGFTHAAFALRYESGISKIPVVESSIPSDVLVTIIQRGFQYIELDANMHNVDPDGEFVFLRPWDVLTKSLNELRQFVEDMKKIIKENKDKHARDHEDMTEALLNESGVSSGPEAMDSTHSSQLVALGIPRSDIGILRDYFTVIILTGHSSEVLGCAWSSTASLLASGSTDSTARIWKVPDGPCCSRENMSPPNVHVLNHISDSANKKKRHAITAELNVLKHFKDVIKKKRRYVTALDWKGDGTLLGTGCFDGQVRIWSNDGELKNSLIKHKRPVVSLKWNKKGDFLVSGSVDKTAIVWNVRTWKCEQQFKFHSDSILDVDWQDNISFATCSKDKMIYVFKIGEDHPIRVLSTHHDDVNAIKWNPTGSLLASCSDDSTVKIWNQGECLHDLRQDDKILTIAWSPTGHGTNNPDQKSILASASCDSTIKLWDPELGTLLFSLNGHRKSVSSVAFSPNGKYLASGSEDERVHIWSVKEGRLLRTFHQVGPVSEVCWNHVGNKIAAHFSTNIVRVWDFWE